MSQVEPNWSHCVFSSGVRRKFLRGVSFSGVWWLLVFGMGCLWRQYLTS